MRVGQVTLKEGDTVRTGVTAIHPLDVSYLEETVFAGFHNYNGFGEVTGSHWIAETGILTSPICMSSAFSVGVLRDALLAHPMTQGIGDRLHQPMAAETFDGALNDGWQRPDNARARPRGACHRQRRRSRRGRGRRWHGHDVPRVQGGDRHLVAHRRDRAWYLHGR